eukprot:15359416-Ditylum_brightwellii.AAC.1
MSPGNQQNWKQIGIYDKVKKIVNKVWRKNKLTISNSPERTKTEFQLGGTAILITDKWVRHVCHSGSNRLGSWSIVTIKGKLDRRITIVSAYRVCQESLDQAGSSTCWKQQWRQLKKKGHPNPDPRKIFLKDFSYFIEDRIGNDEELIIGIDTNKVDIDGLEIKQFIINNDLIE